MRIFINNRIVVSVLFLVMALSPQFALAFFSDTEESTGQRFGAAELLFAKTFDNQELYVGPGLAIEHEFVLPVLFSTSSVDSNYDVRVITTSGDEVFCAALALETTLGTDSSSGYLTDFASDPYDTPGEVMMSVSYNDNERAIPHNATCTAEVVVEAWQSNMPKATAGYRDAKQFTIKVTAHMVVLNEVLPRPNTTDTQVPNVEFIELYNNSDFAVDVLGFNITELTAGGLPTNHFIANIAAAPASALIAYDGSLSTIVPAHGYLALRYRGTASYLNDGGDTITLFDTGTGAAIDSYRYETALVGKSDARIPDGVGAWIDPIPTPDRENVADELTIVMATSTAATSVFADLVELETSSSTEDDVEVASSTASSTEEVADTETTPIVEISTSTPSVEEETEAVEDLPTTVEVEPEVVEEEEIPESDPLPLTDTNTAPEEALLDPEPAARVIEEEEVVPEDEVVTPPVT